MPIISDNYPMKGLFQCPPALASLFFVRFLAESNCCKRFCRPAPNHSAKEPFVFRAIASAKIDYIFRLCNTPALFFCFLRFYFSQLAIHIAAAASRYRLVAFLHHLDYLVNSVYKGYRYDGYDYPELNRGTHHFFSRK